MLQNVALHRGRGSDAAFVADLGEFLHQEGPSGSRMATLLGVAYTVTHPSDIRIVASPFKDPNLYPRRGEEGFLAVVKSMISMDLERGGVYRAAFLYEAHKAWCARVRRAHVSPQLFADNLAALGCIKGRDKKGINWTMPRSSS